MTNKDFIYIYQGDTTYLILYKDIKIGYIDLENFDFANIDKIKTKRQEKRILNRIIDILISELYEYNKELYYKILENKEI